MGFVRAGSNGNAVLLAVSVSSLVGDSDHFRLHERLEVPTADS